MSEWNGKPAKDAGDLKARGLALMEHCTIEELPIPSDDEGAPSADDGGSGDNGTTASATTEERPRAKPELIITESWDVTVHDALKILQRDGGRTLFQRAGDLVRITREQFEHHSILMPPNAPIISVMPRSILGVTLTRLAQLVKFTGKDDQLVPAHPPAWLLNALCEMKEWAGIPPLATVIETPVMRYDGTLITQNGYDRATGLFLECRGDLPIVPEHPTLGDAIAAREALEHVVCDVPFGTDAHRSGWLAYVLTLVGRYLFHGATPCFLFDATTRGSGKDLVAQVGAIIATGHPAAGYTYAAGDDAEVRKAITTIAMAAPRAWHLNNLVGEFGGPALCRLLASTDWCDRILGGNNKYDGPWLSVVSASGNNVRLGVDMDRRVAHIRLEPTCERPEERCDFVHRNLEAWVRAEQTRLLGCALTILRAYYRAGCPAVDLAPWGTYEAWSAAIRRPLVWCGAADPADARAGLASSAPVDDAIGRFVAGWNELMRIHGRQTAADALRRVYPDVSPYAPESAKDPFPSLREAMELLLVSHPGKPPGAGALGRLLGTHRGRVFDGVALHSKIVNGRAHWGTVPVKPGSPISASEVD